MLASRIFATEEMKSAATEFIKMIASPDDDQSLLLDTFLAGAIWYKSTH